MRNEHTQLALLRISSVLQDASCSALICASLAGTIAHALDDALRLRQRGRARIDHACEMRELFDSYCNLAGPFADAEDASHRGAAYLIYCDAFRRLQERCRADAK